MHEVDIAYQRNRYRTRYSKHGYAPETLGWGKGGRQSLRFSVLGGIGIGTSSSVLDVGCGFGDLYSYLKKTAWSGEYLGIDLVNELLDEARRQHPGISVQNRDLLRDPLPMQYDYVVSAGIFNLKLHISIRFIPKCMIQLAIHKGA